MPDPTTIFISAGEASGEAYGALLLSSLKKHLEALGRRAHFVGMGGTRMVAAGLDPVVRAEDMAVMGITEVVRHLPRIYREFRRLKRSIRTHRPSIAILIDFPDIHFKLAEEFHSLGIPVLFFVSPQLWAWKKHRIKLVQKYVTRMLVIFPFEEQFYRERGVSAEFVGHPLADLPLPTISRVHFAAQNNLDPAHNWIALLPGSRAKEIRDNLPEMLAAAKLLLAHRSTENSARNTETRVAGSDDVAFIMPLAPTLTAENRSMVFHLIQQHAPGLTVRTVDDARSALFHARASVVASGTATVEAALIGNPFVVVYRVSPLTYAIAKRVVTVPHVAMANLIAGKRIVPELIQNDFTAENIVQHLEPLLPDGPQRQSMMQELERVRALLSPGPGETHGGAIDRVAAIALEVLGVPSPVRESVQS
ncbi:MAG TPA: lipid-A-disaccharide synthase [Terracidiphilus sp.]|nr:lipid-A-disaccharide synthase [Terracidiphilus sp.]